MEVINEHPRGRFETSNLEAAKSTVVFYDINTIENGGWLLTDHISFKT
ncbi:MAG: hypothetical protein J2P21_04280 [Chloracidobacterium sp.]|nr:hypothetical protein [Chloracidobacterium sp.]